LAVRHPSVDWLNEIRARRVREGRGFVDAEDALSTDGAHLVETNILAAEVLKAIGRLPEAPGQIRSRQRSIVDNREALRIEGVRVLRGSRRRVDESARALVGH
jgi:hypothetical protein